MTTYNEQLIKPTITIIPADGRFGSAPAGKLADAELHFVGGLLDGLKLIGFAVWETRGRRSVTVPARQYSVNGERRSFGLLRPVERAEASDAVKSAILQAYQAVEDGRAQAQPVHRFDRAGQALCGSSNREDGDAPATHDPAEVTCVACQQQQAARGEQWGF